MSAPTARRRRHRGPDHTFLPSLAGIVDQATADDPGHVMVRVTGPIHPEVELGFRSLDPGSHPFDVVAGFEAPEDWTVFGLRTTGRAHHLDDPSAPPRRVASTFLVDRLGREASVLRFDDEVLEPPGPAQGTIPDLCRRVLGMPTAPAPRTTARPVDRDVARSTDRSWASRRQRAQHLGTASPSSIRPSTHRRRPTCSAVADPASLASIARRHADATTWHDLRHAPHPLPLPDGPLPADIARWMDDGFFARWTIGAFPPLPATVMTLRDRFGTPLGPQLLESVLAILEA